MRVVAVEVRDDRARVDQPLRPQLVDHRGPGRLRPVGIVTDRDVAISVVALGLDPTIITVGDVMSVQLVTAAADADLLEAVALMRRHRVRRLIVPPEIGGGRVTRSCRPSMGASCVCVARLSRRSSGFS